MQVTAAATGAKNAKTRARRAKHAPAKSMGSIAGSRGVQMVGSCTNSDDGPPMAIIEHSARAPKLAKRAMLLALISALR
jgi:hypothetical protein